MKWKIWNWREGEEWKKLQAEVEAAREAAVKELREVREERDQLRAEIERRRADAKVAEALAAAKEAAVKDLREERDQLRAEVEGLRGVMKERDKAWAEIRELKEEMGRRGRMGQMMEVREAEEWIKRQLGALEGEAVRALMARLGALKRSEVLTAVQPNLDELTRAYNAGRAAMMHDVGVDLGRMLGKAEG